MQKYSYFECNIGRACFPFTETQRRSEITINYSNVKTIARMTPKSGFIHILHQILRSVNKNLSRGKCNFAAFDWTSGWYRIYINETVHGDNDNRSIFTDNSRHWLNGQYWSIQCNMLSAATSMELHDEFRTINWEVRISRSTEISSRSNSGRTINLKLSGINYTIQYRAEKKYIYHNIEILTIWVALTCNVLETIRNKRIVNLAIDFISENTFAVFVLSRGRSVIIVPWLNILKD